MTSLALAFVDTEQLDPALGRRFGPDDAPKNVFVLGLGVLYCSPSPIQAADVA